MATSSRKTSSACEIKDPPVAESWSDTNEYFDLMKVARAALRLQPRRYVSSIFGPPWSWRPPHRRYSEYNILNPWRLPTTLRYLLDVMLPASAETPPDWTRILLPKVANGRIWRPTSFYRQPDEYGGVSSFPDEHWFFINGVATNTDMARFNSAYLAHLFHRPVTVIQNATDSLLVDLHECAIGKGFKDDPNCADRKTMTEPAWRATAAILEALNAADTKRVVVVAHSQGTIIMANVLRAITRALQSKLATQKNARWHSFTDSLMGGVQTETHKILRNNLAHSLSELTSSVPDHPGKNLEKLEIYTFANCADKMSYVDADKPVPYMEHFANERDIVARLGILSPYLNGSKGLIHIDGPVFEQKKAWGHLLNEHYLTAIDDYKYPGADEHQREEDPYPHKGGGSLTPRLYEYFHGNKPTMAEQAPRQPKAANRAA